MEIILTGMVLQTYDVGDFDKMIVILTEYGKISVRAFGIRFLRNENAAACMEFAYSEFLVSVRNGMCRLKKAQLIKTVIRPGKSLTQLSLAFYIAEVCLYAATDFPIGKDDSRVHDEGLFSCAANALFILSKDDRNILLVKSVFEMRLMAVLGNSPDMPYCSVCQADCREVGGFTAFHLINGNLRCANCRKTYLPERTDYASERRDDDTVLLSESALSLAMRTVSAPDNKAYAVNISPELIREFGSFTEKYLLDQFERSFKSLTYFKEIYSNEPEI